MAHKQPGYRFENDWEPEMSISDAKYVSMGIALPIYEEVKLNNTVLNLDSVKHYLEKARKIAVMDCPCRTKRKHCDAPLDVCLMLDDMAEMSETRPFMESHAKSHVHNLSKEEALKVVEKAHATGLVPMAYMRTDTPKPEGVNFICNCCSCCCSIFGLTLRFGMAPHILKSIATTLTDESKCNSCGVCADRCHFGARKMVDGKMTFNKDLCFGCGLCVSTCPTDSIKLIQLT
jgi:ferredoxin